MKFDSGYRGGLRFNLKLADQLQNAKDICLRWKSESVSLRGQWRAKASQRVPNRNPISWNAEPSKSSGRLRRQSHANLWKVVLTSRSHPVSQLMPGKFERVYGPRRQARSQLPDAEHF